MVISPQIAEQTLKENSFSFSEVAEIWSQECTEKSSRTCQNFEHDIEL